MPCLRAMIAGLCLILGFVGPAIAEIPQSRTATTTADFYAAQLAFNHATLVEEYRQHGDRNSRWDAQAEAFLSAAADFWGSPNDELSVEFADRVVALGDAAVAAGCNDPLVVYVLARIGTNSSSHEERQTTYYSTIRESAPKLMKRGYHGYRCMAATLAIRELQHYTDEASKRQELLRVAGEQLVRAMTQTPDPGHQRVLLMRAEDDLMRKQDASGMESLRDAILNEPGIDPWLRDVSVGQLEIWLAWKARGGGWASEVDEAGWVGFRRHIGKAREHLTRAWELDPLRPEAAAKMIEVAMAGSDDPVVEMRQWFDRAVTAQFDYIPAYDKLEWGMMPRWHGSHEARYAFGLECASTERFETQVPWRPGGFTTGRVHPPQERQRGCRLDMAGWL